MKKINDMSDDELVLMCPFGEDDLQAYEEADFECDGNCRECVSRMWEGEVIQHN